MSKPNPLPSNILELMADARSAGITFAEHLANIAAEHRAYYSGEQSPTSTAALAKTQHETQRKIQDMRWREIKAKRRSDGLCVTCAKPSRPGKCQCQKCADAAAKAKHQIKTGKAPLPKKQKPLTRLTGGVTRQTNRDGYGRSDDYYVATAMIHGKAYTRRWSITKHGEAGAKLAASLQKLLWLVEKGVWNPADGDPLAIMSYAESFSGNREYDDCEISDVSSPWIHERAR